MTNRIPIHVPPRRGKLCAAPDQLSGKTYTEDTETQRAQRRREEVKERGRGMLPWTASRSHGRDERVTGGGVRDRDTGVPPVLATSVIHPSRVRI